MGNCCKKPVVNEEALKQVDRLMNASPTGMYCSSAHRKRRGSFIVEEDETNLKKIRTNDMIHALDYYEKRSQVYK